MIANSGQRWCKVRAKMQVYLRSLPNRSLSYAKMAHTENRTSSLLVRYAEVKPIIRKDSANRVNYVKSAWIFCMNYEESDNLEVV